MTDLQQYLRDRKEEYNDIGSHWQKPCLIYNEWGDHKLVEVRFKRWANEEEFEATILDPFDEEEFNATIDDLSVVVEKKLKSVFNYMGEQLCKI